MLKVLNFFLGPFRSLTLIAGALLFTYITLQMGWEEFQHRTLVEVSLNDYLKMRPKPRYLRLTDCQVDLEQAYFETATAFVPLRPPDSEGAIRVVLDSARYLSIVRELAAKEEDPEAYAVLRKKHAAKLQEISDFTGWTTVKTELSPEFKKLGVKVPTALIVLQEGREPGLETTMVFLMICAGAFGLGCLGLYAFAKEAA